MNVDLIALSVPVFFILIGIELAYSFYKKLGYYRLNDSISNLSQGIGQQVTGIFMKTVLFFGYSYLYTHWRLSDIPQTWWMWILLFIGVDFCYYWFHRMSHQVNALWAAHIVHHQSEDYNLTVALRQSWFQSWFSWVFYLPLAFIGFHPLMFITLSAANTLYQFWIHTQSIKSMGFLEHVLNTPSHHRVHHGSNPKYIDKNHAGTLIIWDKLFGTFQKEEEPVYYGITTPLASWNPVWANVHYWVELWQTAARSPKWADKINIFLKPPGWYPARLGGFKTAPEIDPAHYRKFDLRVNRYVSYLLLQFLIALLSGAAFLFFYTHFPLGQQLIAGSFLLLSLVICGALLEDKPWLHRLEYLRLIGSTAWLLFLLNQSFMARQWIFLLIGLQLISLCWFLFIHQSKEHVEKI